MALVSWEPIGELNSLQGEMNRLFNTFFDNGTAQNGGRRQWVPAMDLIETADDYVLKGDLPGLGEGDVNIEVEGRVLTVSGERKDDHEGQCEGFYRLERAIGGFSRSLTLPEGVDPGDVQATFDRGVLEVRIPKPEQRKPHRISISVADQEKAIEGEAYEQR